MQNYVSTENWSSQIFDWYLGIKDIDKKVLLWWPLTIILCTCVHLWCNVLYPLKVNDLQSIETSSNICIGKPYLLKVLFREPACIVYRATSGNATTLYTVANGQLISGQFFVLNVLAYLKKTNKSCKTWMHAVRLYLACESEALRP